MKQLVVPAMLGSLVFLASCSSKDELVFCPSLSAPVEGARAFVVTDEQKQNIITNIPANRLGNVDDISNGCVYLASDEAGFITGTTLHINGGMNMI